MNTPVSVLFIEDNPGDARLVREQLSQTSPSPAIRLTWVDRLDKGLEHLRAGQIEAILLDLSLPDSHGLDTLERVLEAAPAIPVIVMTGTADETIAMQAIQAGAQDYLIKGLIDGVLLARAIHYAVERKRSELQLRELVDIVEHSQDVIFRKDLDGIIRSWNRGAELVYGYAPEEIIGRSVSILMEPEKHQEMEQFMEEIQMGRKVERFETERIRKDGTRILVSVNVSPICDEQGKIVAASTVAHDITAKKQAEEALKNSEMRLNNIISNAAEVIVVVNDREEITLFNHSAQKEFGWTEAEILGQPLSLLIPGRFAEVHHAHIRSFARSPETTRDMEARQRLICVRRDGSEFTSTVGISKHMENGRMFFTAIIQDITEKLRADEAVQQMRDRFQALTENAPDGVALVDMYQRMQFVSPAGRRMFGYSLQEQIEIDPAEHTHPEDLPMVVSALSMLIEDPAHIPTLQYRFRHKDGSWRWLESTFTNLLDVESIQAIVINFRDITGRRQAEDALRESEKRFRSLIENGSDMVSILAADGTLLYESPSTNPMLGYQHEEFMGQSLFQLIHPEDLERVQREFARLLQEPGLHRRQQFRLQHRDGTWRWVDAVGTNLLADSSVRGIVVNYHDITDRREAEKKIAFQADLLGAVGSAVIATDLDGGVIYWNRAAEALYGWSAAEAQGRRITDLTPAQETKEQALEIMDHMRQGQPWSGEFVVQSRDGKEFPAFVSNSPLLDETGTLIGIIGISSDISQLKRAEEELERLNERFQLAARAAGLGIWDWDIENNILIWDDQMYALYGLRREQFSGPYQAWLSGLHPDDRARADDAVRQALEGDVAYDHEFRVVWPDGSVHHIRGVGETIFNEQGRPLRMTGVNYDISERKQAEKLLLERKALLDKSQEIAHVGSWELDLAANRLTWSDEVYRIFGLRPQEFGANYQAFLEAVHPDDRAAVDSAYSGSLQAGAEDYQIEHRIIRRDTGEVRTVLEKCEHLRDGTGRVIRSIGIVQDITERKQAEQAVRRSEQRFRSLIENNAEAIALLAKDGTILFESPAATRILGFEMDELIGRNALELVHPEDLPAAAVLLGGLVETSGAVVSTEIRYRRKDGAYCWVEATGSNLLEEPSVQAIVVNYRDITGRIQDEQRIRQQLRRLNILRKIDQGITGSAGLGAVFDIILRDGLNELGADACIVLLYDPEEQLLKYEHGIGMRTNALQHTELKLGEGYAGRAALSRQTVIVSSLLKHNAEFLDSPSFSQEGFACYFGVPLIVKDEIKGVLEIFHRAPLQPGQEWLDFMETLAGQTAIAIDNAQLWQRIQRQNLELEQRVAERTSELEHANRAKDEFLATMSHELRTPLNSILGLSESLLEQRRDPLSEYQQGSLRIVEASGRHLLDLINDILDLSKIEAGKLDYYPQVVDVPTLCRASLSFIKEQAVRKSISLVYPEKHTDLRIHADPRRLKQALVNLLTNAVKFTPEHGQVTLEVHLEPEEDRIHFSVTDTGIGIAEKDLKQLFQPFVQVDSSLNRQYEGTGLGLVLVERLTDLHGGSVQVESAPGQGSRFTIIIPWRQQVVAEQEIIEAGGELPAGETPPRAAAPPRNVTVLLAEDNAANTLMISEYLESRGYRVVNAYDGVDALEKAEAAGPHIILMDIQMPAMDGLEATRCLRSNPRFTSTPIVALTALAMPGDRERCLEAGANEYMSKPVSLKALAKTIEDLLRSR